MKKLTYKKVFSKYSVHWSEQLARLSFAIYKKIRIALSDKFPLKESEKFNFEERYLRNHSSANVPKGYNYLTHSDEEGRIELEYIDFYDYLPKENLDIFKKSLKRFASCNKRSRFGPFRTLKDQDRIDNMGRYVDWWAFTHLDVVALDQNRFLEQCVTQVEVSLRNLSPSFLLVKYRFCISSSFNEQLKTLYMKEYEPYTEVCRQVGIPWYRPQKFGKYIYTGNDARRKECYVLVSELKWRAFKELKRYFTIQFEQNRIFPPTFDTYLTNIRPQNDLNNLKFWDSVMLERDSDYAPKYNACVSWGYECGKYEGKKLSAYCGGKFSEFEHLPEIATHDMSDIFAVYLVASTFRRIAERDIALCNKRISTAIQNSKASEILKTRVSVEKQLYYSYRFISEFTGETIDYGDVKEFRNRFFKESSFTAENLKSVSRSTAETKKQIDTLIHLLDDAAEYGSAKANWTLQWFMMIVTVLSLIVAVLALAGFEFASLVDVIGTISDYLFSFLRVFLS